MKCFIFDLCELFPEKSPFQKSALPGIPVLVIDFFPEKFSGMFEEISEKKNFPEKSRLQKHVFPEEHFFESDFFPKK